MSDVDDDEEAERLAEEWWDSTMALVCFSMLGLLALVAYFFFSDPYNYVPASEEEIRGSTSEGK